MSNPVIFVPNEQGCRLKPPFYWYLLNELVTVVSSVSSGAFNCADVFWNHLRCYCHGRVHRCDAEVDPEADTVETKLSFKNKASLYLAERMNKQTKRQTRLNYELNYDFLNYDLDEENMRVHMQTT